MAKTGGRERGLQPAGGGLGHPAGKFLEGKAMHVAGNASYRMHPAP